MNINFKTAFLYVVRHGESIANFNKTLGGHSDVSLTQKGF